MKRLIRRHYEKSHYFISFLIKHTTPYFITFIKIRPNRTTLFLWKKYQTDSLEEFS